MDTNIEMGPAQAFSRFNAAFAQMRESQHAILEEIGQFARDESLRFFNLRLERTGALIDKLSTSQGVSGIFAAQQEWLRDLITDYSEHNMRMASAMRGVAQTVVAKAADAASETIDRAQAQAGEAVRQTGHAVDEAQDHLQAAAQDMEQHVEYGQETQH